MIRALLKVPVSIAYMQKKKANILLELTITSLILFGSHVVQKAFNLPIPSTVLGMILLFALLLSGLLKEEQIGASSDFALEHLTFLFIPGGVGLLTSMDLIKAHWAGILGVVVIGAIIVIAVTGLVVQVLNRKGS